MLMIKIIFNPVAQFYLVNVFSTLLQPKINYIDVIDYSDQSINRSFYFKNRGKQTSNKSFRSFVPICAALNFFLYF